MNIVLLSTLVILNIIFCLNYNLIAKKINIFDHPDRQLKIHKKKTPLLGGIFIISNIFIIIFFDQFIDEIFNFEKKREIFSFSIFTIFFFLIGLYDDKFKISFSIRIILGVLLTLMVLLINQNLRIEYLQFSFYEHEILLRNFTIFFSLFSILSFVHATNMFDGINSQLLTFYIILNTFLFYNSNFNEIYLFLYPTIITLFILNFNGKIFLGDSGSYSLGALYSFFLIYEYTTFQNIVFADIILILALIPGVELVRLSIYRLLKGRNIFSGDLEHLHHLLINEFGQLKTNFIVSLMIIIPISLMMIIKINLHFVFLSSLLFYFMIIYFLKK